MIFCTTKTTSSRKVLKHSVFDSDKLDTLHKMATPQTIDTIIKSLGQNRVTVDIKTNHMNEMNVFTSGESQQVFNKFPNIFANFKGMKAPAPVTRRPSPPLQQHIADPLLFQVVSFVDKTISLFKTDDINKKVDEFRTTLSDNLTNHVDAYRKLKLKEVKFVNIQGEYTRLTVDDIRDSLAVTRKTPLPMLHYVSKLLKSNIVHEDKGSDPKYIVSYEHSESPDSFIKLSSNPVSASEPIEPSSGFLQVLESAKAKKIEGLDEQKLKKMLVKDIRNLASEIGISVYKTVEGKRTALLKEELVAAISNLLTPKD